jgi:hypothetical protein
LANASLTLPALAAAAGLLWVAGLWLLGAYTPPAVVSWRRLARYRGLDDQRPLADRLAARLSFLRRLQEEMDLRRLLAIAGSAQDPTAWLLSLLFVSGMACVALLGVDAAIDRSMRFLLFPPWLALAAGATVAVLSYAGLRARAHSRQRRLGRAVADSLIHLAVVTHHQRIPLAEALMIFARCQEDGALLALLGNDGWRRLADMATPDSSSGAGRTALRTSADTYEQIGLAYGVPMFTALAGVLRRVTEKGLSSRDAYTQLARSTYAELLAEARVLASQAKTLIVIPMGLMIFPILLLIGAPLVAALSGIFAR